MFRLRTRPAYSQAELAKIYSRPWEMDPSWSDHALRHAATLWVAGQVCADATTAADLSCGDGHFSRLMGWLEWTLGDFAPGYPHCGPIEATIDEIDPVDVFFLTETLEHLDDPELVLLKIATKAKKLVVSTPLMHQRDENPEHYWAWDREAVEAMLRDTGWSPYVYEQTTPDVGYVFQIHGAVRYKL